MDEDLSFTQARVCMIRENDVRRDGALTGGKETFAVHMSDDLQTPVSGPRRLSD